MRALRQLRVSGEHGRALAKFGTVIGLLVLLAVLCLTVMSMILVYYGVGAIDGFWHQIQP